MKGTPIKETRMFTKKELRLKASAILKSIGVPLLPQAVDDMMNGLIAKIQKHSAGSVIAENTDQLTYGYTTMKHKNKTMSKNKTSKIRLMELAGLVKEVAATDEMAGATTIREAAQFSFTIDMMGTFQTDDYNTEDDDVAYIQRLLDKAGADAYAKADPPEEILVRAFDAQGLAKAKAAVEDDGFEVQEI